jgi:hypothetical protein
MASRFYKFSPLKLSQPSAYRLLKVRLGARRLASTASRLSMFSSRKLSQPSAHRLLKINM